MARSRRYYENLFEDLMRYTSFKSTKDITTNSDLNQFFEEVRQHSDKQGRGFKAGKLDKIFSNIVGSLRRTIVTPNAHVLQSRKLFTNFEDARKSGQVFARPKELDIYRSFIKTHKTKKVVVVWRDSKGRFAKSPSLKKQGDE